MKLPDTGEVVASIHVDTVGHGDGHQMAYFKSACRPHTGICEKYAYCHSSLVDELKECK